MFLTIQQLEAVEAYANSAAAGWLANIETAGIYASGRKQRAQDHQRIAAAASCWRIALIDNATITDPSIPLPDLDEAEADFWACVEQSADEYCYIDLIERAGRKVAA
jgi:hypothetical protein